MHPFSVLALGIFVAGYTTARWDLVTRLYELAIFAWDHGILLRTGEGFVFVSIFFFMVLIPVNFIVSQELAWHPRAVKHGISAREQLRRRGSF